MAINKQTIELHIEELVLHGFAPGQRYQIAGEVEAELTRLFAESGLPPSFNTGMQIGQLQAGSFQVPGADNKLTTGAGIARSIYHSFPSTLKKEK